MCQILRYNDVALPELGFSDDALTGIFLWAEGRSSQPTLLNNIPTEAEVFIRREFRAADFSFDNMQNDVISCPDIWTGKIINASDVILGLDTSDPPLHFLPIFYRFNGSRDEFWLVNHGTYGRVTHVIVPAQQLVIFDLARATAPQLLRSLINAIRGAGTRSMSSAPRKRIGLLEMPMNFGHQLINNLSGLQRLLELELEDKLDEIYVIGKEFFDGVQILFPEVSRKIRKWPDVKAFSRQHLAAGHQIFRLGSNVFTRSLYDRLIASGRKRFANIGPIADSPLLAVTVRTSGRRCTNLAETIGIAYRQLVTDFPGLKILLDGWTFPDGDIPISSHVAAALSPQYQKRLTAEMDLARAISERLPSGVIAGNVIGHGISESILEIGKIDAYFTHVGTLQHKLGFFCNATGVIHGPRQQLSKVDTGHYQTETGFSPLFLSPDSVRDIPVDTYRGDGFFDYEIVNHNEVIENLAKCLRKSALMQTCA